MNCKDVVEHMPAFVDNELTEETAAAVKAHVAACPTCRDMARAVQVFADSLTAQIKGYGKAIKPPPGAKEDLLLKLGAAVGEPSPTRRLWIAVAAMFLGAFCMYAWYMMTRTTSPKDRDFSARATDTNALKRWQGELEDIIGRRPQDRALNLVACAYLPAERARSILKNRLGVEPTENALRAAWPAETTLVVRVKRSTSRRERTSELLFEQWSDGRVHIEHSWMEGGDFGSTSGDFRNWEDLAAQSPEFCRELEIVDQNGRLLMGLAIPSTVDLREDVVRSLAGRAPAADLARRLLALRLASCVSTSDELEARLMIPQGPMAFSEDPLPSKSLEHARIFFRRLTEL